MNKYVYEIRWRTDNNPFEGAGQDRILVEAVEYKVCRGSQGDFDSVQFMDEWCQPLHEFFSRPASIERLNKVEPREQDEAS